MTNKTPGQIILDAVANGQYNAASEIMSAELFSNVNECMCQRKEKVAYDFGQAISEGDSAYDTFFKKAMKKFNISSPADLKGEEEKKKFFNYIDKNFKASNEEVEESYEYEMDMDMVDRDDEEEYEYEMDMDSVEGEVAYGDRVMMDMGRMRRPVGMKRAAPGTQGEFQMGMIPAPPEGEMGMGSLLRRPGFRRPVGDPRPAPGTQGEFDKRFDFTSPGVGSVRRPVVDRRPAPGTQGEFQMSGVEGEMYDEEEYTAPEIIDLNQYNTGRRPIGKRRAAPGLTGLELTGQSVPDPEPIGMEGEMSPQQAYPPRRLKDQMGGGY